MSLNQDWFDRARKVLPGGVNSPVRAFQGVGGTPRVIREAHGCHLIDVEGNSLIDYIGSWGAAIVGHAHPNVVKRVAEMLSKGTSFGTPSPPEVELAETIISRVAGLEKIRFVNSGTEAVMSAIRLARAATKRDKIIKFDGGYHGHADALLVQAGSGAATLGLPASSGVTHGAIQDTLQAVYNDRQSVESLFQKWGSQIAAVIIEPFAGNMGVVPPKDGFLPFLRIIAHAHGSLLIFDEVMTGFRIAFGGARERLNIDADLYTFGKIIGGGFPVGAYAGRSELMDLISPSGPVYQAGTLSGNPVAMTAGLATLELLDHHAYRKLEALGDRLENGLQAIIEKTGVPARVQRAGSMITLFFSDRPVQNFDDAKNADHSAFAKFFHAMLNRGVHLPPSGYEAWFLSLAHTNEVVDATVHAAEEAMAELVR
ncbi:MAG: glutamate-1-semialdehyde 2,1-aminomutase [Planctomycetota bacterium]